MIYIIGLVGFVFGFVAGAVVTAVIGSAAHFEYTDDGYRIVWREARLDGSEDA